MSISVQSGVSTSENIVWHESSSKIDNPNDTVNKDNPPDGAQRNAAEMDIKKNKNNTASPLWLENSLYQEQKGNIIYLFFNI